MALTITELLRKHGAALLKSNIPGYQKSAARLLLKCRTGELGSHKVSCQACGFTELRHNSCRHRACPQCEGRAQAQWLEDRTKELLPTKYFHVVFTIPSELNELFLANQKICFSLLFSAVNKTLSTVMEQRIHAKIGFLAVLHTWGQKLDFHPHLHCVVPGGGVSKDGRWVPSSKKSLYLAPSFVLAAVFRGILIKSIKAAVRSGKIQFSGDIEALCTKASGKQWVVRATPPFGGAQTVLKYLARYVRKVALSSSRLESEENGSVKFSFSDYRDNARSKTTSLPTIEFLRRFLMHVPIPGMVRIRSFGLLSARGKKERLEQLRQLISGLLPVIVKAVTTVIQPLLCPHCKKATLTIIGTMFSCATVVQNQDSS